MTDPLALVRARVSALRTRHIVIAAVFGLLGAGTWALPDAELPIGAKAFISLALVGAAVWQGSLARQIGLGLAAIDAGTLVVWIYELRAFINGAQVATGVMVGLRNGARHELPVSLEPADVAVVVGHLRTKYPNAAVGFDLGTEAQFFRDPRSLEAR